MADPAVVADAWRAWREEVASAEQFVAAPDLAVRSSMHDGTGSYDVRFTGSIANTNNCAVFAQLMSGIGWVVAGPSTEGFLTEFDVHVFNTAGNPADAEFSLYAIC